MNRKILSFYSLLAICLLLAEGAVAQNYAKKFGLEVSGGVREYGGDRGTRYFLAQPPDYQAIGGSFSYYVNPSFDATIFGAVGDLGHRHRGVLSGVGRRLSVRCATNRKCRAPA